MGEPIPKFISHIITKSLIYLLDFRGDIISSELVCDISAKTATVKAYKTY